MLEEHQTHQDSEPEKVTIDQFPNLQRKIDDPDFVQLELAQNQSAQEKVFIAMLLLNDLDLNKFLHAEFNQKKIARLVEAFKAAHGIYGPNMVNLVNPVNKNRYVVMMKILEDGINQQLDNEKLMQMGKTELIQTYGAELQTLLKNQPAFESLASILNLDIEKLSIEQFLDEIIELPSDQASRDYKLQFVKNNIKNEGLKVALKEFERASPEKYVHLYEAVIIDIENVFWMNALQAIGLELKKRRNIVCSAYLRFNSNHFETLVSIYNQDEHPSKDVIKTETQQLTLDTQIVELIKEIKLLLDTPEGQAYKKEIYEDVEFLAQVSKSYQQGLYKVMHIGRMVRTAMKDLTAVDVKPFEALLNEILKFQNAFRQFRPNYNFFDDYTNTQIQIMRDFLSNPQEESKLEVEGALALFVKLYTLSLNER